MQPSYDELAEALRILLAVVKLADVGIDDEQYRAAVERAEAVLARVMVEPSATSATR